MQQGNQWPGASVRMALHCMRKLTSRGTARLGSTSRPSMTCGRATCASSNICAR